jgi:hypothetical protein
VQPLFVNRRVFKKKYLLQGRRIQQFGHAVQPLFVNRRVFKKKDSLQGRSVTVIARQFGTGLSRRQLQLEACVYVPGIV